jgi:hypothetical protein
VLPFLMRHNAYDVGVCAEAVQRAGVQDAHAYLLERLGQLHKAFQLHLTRLNE